MSLKQPFIFNLFTITSFHCLHGRGGGGLLSFLPLENKQGVVHSCFVHLLYMLAFVLLPRLIARRGHFSLAVLAAFRLTLHSMYNSSPGTVYTFTGSINSFGITIHTKHILEVLQHTNIMPQYRNDTV